MHCSASRRVRGHLDGVINMVEQEAYCPDLMEQVSALQASLEKVNRILLENHLETCVTEAIQAGGGQDKIRELIDALRFNSSLTTFREAEPLELAPLGPDSVAALCCLSSPERRPGRVVAHHGTGNSDELPHAGDHGNLVGLAGVGQTVI